VPPVATRRLLRTAEAAAIARCHEATIRARAMAAPRQPSGCAVQLRATAQQQAQDDLRREREEWRERQRLSEAMRWNTRDRRRRRAVRDGLNRRAVDLCFRATITDLPCWLRCSTRRRRSRAGMIIRPLTADPLRHNELTQSCPVRPRRPHLPWLMRVRCRHSPGTHGVTPRRGTARCTAAGCG
jgi:hypothetical protein